ncbi:MAG: TlyA family RNA methyltransferase [Clostridia bacterium]|nr:TlyA family RNA methyltransferase [Clostridia bacterium]
MAEKKRLDALIVELGLCESREKAKSAIMAGDVFVNGHKALKAGDTVRNDDKIEVRGGMEFVSRGGYKLKKAMAAFPINLTDKVCMDIGASTGGFTDCMLQNGAKKVYCIDVGYGQLAWKLRSDERVVNLERTNIRYVTREQIPDAPDFASVDVSFISLKLVLPVAYGLLNDAGECVCLIKPQFEAGRDKVGKKGVVREKSTHVEVAEAIVAFAKKTGFTVAGLDYSPIKGPEGNIEYLLYLKKNGEPAEVDVAEVVSRSHAELDRNA